MIKRVSEALSKKENGEKGFTLIELLVVVIIIGILSAVAIPIFLNMRQGAWKSSVESDVSNAALTVEQATTANNGSIIGIGQSDGPNENTYILTVGGAGDALATGTFSEGNTIEITVDDATQTYTIVGESDNLDDPYTYTSATGSGTWDTTAP